MELEHYRDIQYRATRLQFSVTDRELSRSGINRLDTQDPLEVLDWLVRCTKAALAEGLTVEDSWKL